jgi:hypothetical protein
MREVSVYVDMPAHRYGRMLMCHMLADSIEELHAMADKIGIQRKWYQGPPKTKTPHYDICKSKRALAIAAGAIEADRKTVVGVMKRIRRNNEQRD